MIHVEKYTTVPAALVQVQNTIEQNLLDKKEKFKWIGDHYNRPIKEELKTLYHKKCAFCEQKLTETDTEQKFTVEHYRPKTHYWWLGNEWTNLFPTCLTCNEHKEDVFPLKIERKRVNSPVLTAQGNLDRTHCNANSATLVNEEPAFLHPEVDQPEIYFEFLPNGKVQEQEGLNNWQKTRAKTMIQKFLGRPSLVEKRKTWIDELKADLRRAVKNFLEICQNGYDKQHIQLAFNPCFDKLFANVAHKREFAALAKEMTQNFEDFFAKDFEREVFKLLQYAKQEYQRDYKMKLL